jgi:glycosyltransferase involved in cell wall biosynthesis
MTCPSIFEQYYSATEFHDRFAKNQADAIAVIIPTVHTSELWRANLLSIYREVPVKQLLIGDGGCIDETIEIAKEFPRVVIHDHRSYKSLGFSIRKLIEAVETDWFIYLHSDVYLPEGWFDKMISHKGQYDWFGCRMQQTVMVEYDNGYGERPYAGSQIGRKAVFSEGLGRIDDDYVYRQEDFVFSDIVSRGRGREGKIDDVFHYHQTIKKASPFWNPRNVKVKISQELSKEEELRVWDTQFRGIIKYLQPTSQWAISDAGHSAYTLIKMNVITRSDLYAWVEKVNPVWLPIVKQQLLKQRILHGTYRLISQLKPVVRKVFKL